MRGSPGRSIEEEQSRRRTIIWAVGATGVVGLIIGLLWLLRGQAPVVTWEQQNRDAILTLKDEAEQLAVDGDNQAAYEKYQELERMVSGQTITDSYLQQELARSWVRKDSLYDLLTAAKRAQAAKEAAATMPSLGPSPGSSASAHSSTPPPEQVSPASRAEREPEFFAASAAAIAGDAASGAGSAKAAGCGEQASTGETGSRTADGTDGRAGGGFDPEGRGFSVGKI